MCINISVNNQEKYVERQMTEKEAPSLSIDVLTEHKH